MRFILPLWVSPTMQRAAVLQRPDSQPDKRPRTLATACVAHALHDGYTDLLYLLLPIWQAEFGIGYGALALLRGLAVATMAGLQVPAGQLAERVGGRAVLVVGTGLAALGYVFAGASHGLIGLCLALIAIGCGSSTQHPIASTAVSRVYGHDARRPLGTYNFAGDLGKAAIPGAASLLLVLMHWQNMLFIMSALGGFIAAAVALFLPTIPKRSSGPIKADNRLASPPGGFAVLLIIGILDTSVRMGFLMFLPFLLKAKGASLSITGMALALVFIGGAAGKFACGWLGGRFGVLPTVLLTEGGTAFAILAVLTLPLVPTLLLLSVLGTMLNGTSTVLYGTVPDLVESERVQQGFAIFYTATIGAGGIAPVIYGILGDVTGARGATVATAVTALAILPLAIFLGSYLSGSQQPAEIAGR
jgi:MFS transporter, FSR family, fosmidomycin resistance protein